MYITLTFIMNITLIYIVIIMQIKVFLVLHKKLQENKDENVNRFAMSALRGKFLKRETEREKDRESNK